MVSYINRDKLEGHGLVAKLIKMTKRLDLYSYSEQQVVNKKSSQKMIVRFMHKYEVMFFEFEGFGDLLGQEATLYTGNVEISSGFIGINNDVALYYQCHLPEGGMAITITNPNESSFY